MGQPTLIALSSTINDKRRDYYEELAAQSTGNDLTKWLIYFGKTIIDAQEQTIKQVVLLLQWHRTKLMKKKWLTNFQGNHTPTSLGKKVVGLCW